MYLAARAVRLLTAGEASADFYGVPGSLSVARNIPITSPKGSTRGKLFTVFLSKQSVRAARRTRDVEASNSPAEV
jgi:hypothetical protein